MGGVNINIGTRIMQKLRFEFVRSSKVCLTFRELLKLYLADFGERITSLQLNIRK